LLEDFDVSVSIPTPLLSDSTGAISIARDPVKHELTKHIDVDAHFTRSNKMPDEWRQSILVPILKNKGGVQSCTNYRGVKLMSHTMKLWERIIKHRLRGVTNVTENQFGFMPGRSTMEAIFLIRQLMERCREQKKDLHMIFIDLEKDYDKVIRNVMWWALQKHKVSSKYITLIKDMYDNVVTSVRTSGGDTNDIPIII
jgi:hypothetical protein